MKQYSGYIIRNQCRVFVSEGVRRKRLPVRLDLANHSPTGFAWGYGGSGPAQLALAILADHFHIPKVRRRRRNSALENDALRLYQRFKWLVVSQFPEQGTWSLNTREIDDWLRTESIRGGR